MGEGFSFPSMYDNLRYNRTLFYNRTLCRIATGFMVYGYFPKHFVARNSIWCIFFLVRHNLLTLKHTMSKKRQDDLIAFRIPSDEKELMEAIATKEDVSLSRVVLRFCREGIAKHSPAVEEEKPKAPAKAKAKAPIKEASSPKKKK